MVEKDRPEAAGWLYVVGLRGVGFAPQIGMGMGMQMTKFRELASVILCECGPVSDYGTARIAIIASISDGIAMVEDKQFPIDSNEPWDIVAGPSPIRHVLKLDTPDNRRFYGLGAAPA